MDSSRLDYLVLTATRLEHERILEAMGGIAPTTMSHRRTVFGQLSGQRIAVVEAGIGVVNTAQTLTAILENRPVGHVVQCGIGGAFPSAGLVTGDVAVATEEILGEFGVVEESGWSDGSTIGIPLLAGDPPIYNTIPVDTELSERTAAGAKEAASGFSVASGPFLTVQNVTGTDTQAQLLDHRFGAVCENMEGAAAAQICLLYGVPFAEVRGISNVVEKRDLSKWDIPLAAERAQDVVLRLVAS